VGAGEIGELFVQGPTVMAGYWPVARDSGVEYATGDRVSWDASRQLCYHGRRDFMVKVRGYRVEIHDVEFALAEHPLVAETVVTACDDGDSGKVLVAHVVARDASLSVLGLKTHCSRRLPSYMVPQRVQLLAELPITSTGKVDRQKLQQDYERSLLNQRAFTQKHQSDQA
jgi:acyl-CoA synthetase (AMP-forming)/AMP-acid ligase II